MKISELETVVRVTIPWVRIHPLRSYLALYKGLRVIYDAGLLGPALRLHTLSEATPMKIGVVAFATTLVFAGASYAADKITLICADGEGKDDYSLSIDLDRKLASFHMSDLPDADGIPVTRVTENYVWFQNKALSGIYSQGKLDRITGSLHFFHRHLNNAKDLYLRCKPAKPFDGPAL